MGRLVCNGLSRFVAYQGSPALSSIVTYTGVLDVEASTVSYVVGLLGDLRDRIGTRAGTRVLSTWDQAVLVLRWFIDGARMRDLVRDNGVSTSTGYKYLHEGIDVLAAQAPDLASALETAKGAGWSHVNLDGTVMAIDRVATPGPGVADLWWSGKHAHHGGNIRSCPTLTDGRYGPLKCGLDVNTTPSAPAPPTVWWKD